MTERLWIGRKLTDADAGDAVAHGVTAVLDLTGEFSEASPFLSVAYRQLPVLDLTAPTQAQLDQAVDFIREQSAHGVVYVHCKVGYSRTAAIAGAYLIASGLADSVERACTMLREARGTIIIRPEVFPALEAYAAGASRGIVVRSTAAAPPGSATSKAGDRG